MAGSHCPQLRRFASAAVKLVAGLGQPIVDWGARFPPVRPYRRKTSLWAPIAHYYGGLTPNSTNPFDTVLEICLEFAILGLISHF